MVPRHLLVTDDDDDDDDDDDGTQLRAIMKLKC